MNTIEDYHYAAQDLYDLCCRLLQEQELCGDDEIAEWAGELEDMKYTLSRHLRALGLMKL